MGDLGGSLVRRRQIVGDGLGQTVSPDIMKSGSQQNRNELAAFDPFFQA